MKKKILSLLITLFLIVMLLILTGCSNSKESFNEHNQNQIINDTKEKFENAETPYLYGVKEYSDGVAWASGKDNYWYILDKDGYAVYQTEDVSGYRFEPDKFEDGYCQIFYKGNQILDKQGNIIVPVENGFDSIEYGGNGILKVVIKEENYMGSSEKVGFIDLNTGKYTIPPTEEYPVLNTIALGEGMFAVSSYHDNSTIIINGKTGATVTLEGSNVTYFFNNSLNGYITAKGYNILHIINSNCEVVTLRDEDFEEELTINSSTIGQYGDGLIYVNGIFYDNSGKKVLDVRNKNIYNSPVFVNGYALVKFKNDKGTDYFTIMDKNGNFSFEPKKIISSNNVQDTDTFALFDDIEIMPNSGYLVCRENSKWKVIDATGRTLVTLENGDYPIGQVGKDKILSIGNKDTKISSYCKTLDNQTIIPKKVESKLNNNSSTPVKVITKQSVEN